jgi:hypothetical protein
MAVSILYRASLGFLLAFSNDNGLSPLFAMLIAVAFVLYNLIKRPFIKAYHNFRACFCHFTQFMILFVTMYYRSIKSTAAPTTYASIYSPAIIELVFLIICLIVSALILLYDSYLFIKERCCPNRVAESEEMKKNPVDLSRYQVNEYDKTEEDISHANNSINQEIM